MGSNSVRIMLVDDHAVFRMGLHKIFEQVPEFEVVAESTNGEAVAKAIETKPDVILMDIGEGAPNGIEVVRQILKELPKTAIVIVTALADDDLTIQALRAGATGFALKDAPPATLLEAVRCVSAGEAYLHPHAARLLLNLMGSWTPRGTEDATQEGHLTVRELSVLRLMTEGRRNREIAQELHISERTVGNHIANLYAKLHFTDRTQAIHYAVREGIVKI